MAKTVKRTWEIGDDFLPGTELGGDTGVYGISLCHDGNTVHTNAIHVHTSVEDRDWIVNLLNEREAYNG